MDAEWVQTSRLLPSDGQVVQFVLEHRDLAMTGVYNRSRFASRWSQYDVTAVREWRNLPPQARTPNPASDSRV